MNFAGTLHVNIAEGRIWKTRINITVQSELSFTEAVQTLLVGSVLRHHQSPYKTGTSD